MTGLRGDDAAVLLTDHQGNVELAVTAHFEQTGKPPCCHCGAAYSEKAEKCPQCGIERQQLLLSYATYQKDKEAGFPDDNEHEWGSADPRLSDPVILEAGLDAANLIPQTPDPYDVALTAARATLSVWRGLPAEHRTSKGKLLKRLSLDIEADFFKVFDKNGLSPLMQASIAIQTAQVRGGIKFEAQWEAPGDEDRWDLLALIMRRVLSSRHKRQAAEKVRSLSAAFVESIADAEEFCDEDEEQAVKQMGWAVTDFAQQIKKQPIVINTGDVLADQFYQQAAAELGRMKAPRWEDGTDSEDAMLVLVRAALLEALLDQIPIAQTFSGEEGFDCDGAALLEDNQEAVAPKARFVMTPKFEQELKDDTEKKAAEQALLRFEQVFCVPLFAYRHPILFLVILMGFCVMLLQAGVISLPDAITL